MNGYEKIIKTIRSESDRNRDKYPFKIGKMKTAKICELGEFELDEDDLYYPSGITLKKDDVVIVVQVSDVKFAILQKVVS